MRRAGFRTAPSARRDIDFTFSLLKRRVVHVFGAAHFVAIMRLATISGSNTFSKIQKPSRISWVRFSTAVMVMGELPYCPIADAGHAVLSRTD